jgi:signal transduction histidine kinase
VTADGNSVTLSVTDNGRGITAQEASASHALGILGVRERCALLGGSVDIDGEPGKGTRVRVRVPIQASPPDAGAAR